MADSPKRWRYRFVVTLKGEVLGADEVIVERLDTVMDELDHLKAVDPVIDLDLEHHTVAFEVVVEAGDAVSAVNYASGLLRSAIHASGGATPDWPTLDDEVWGIRLVGITSNAVSESSMVLTPA